jgi:fatty-acyl-CoA synthase
MSPWVHGLTFAHVLDRTASLHGDRDAVVFPQLAHRRTFAEFHADVRTCARALIALDVKPGDHIGIWATNWPQWIVLQFAAATAGAVLVNINPAYRDHELAYVLKQADITILFLTDQFKSTSYFDILDAVCPELKTARGVKIQASACPKLRRVVCIKETCRPGMSTWSEFLAGARDVPDADLERRQGAVKHEDVVNIQYTSGTTGFPKGAMLTHRNLLMNAYHVGERLAFSERDRLCAPVPLYHCFGCVMGSLMCVVFGAALVMPAEAFDPLATLQAVQAEQCTGLYGVPTMFLAELHQPRFDEFNLSSLRTGIMAGSPCPIEVMRAVVDKMGIREITIAYGLTEASPVITQTRTTDSLEHRVSTVGTVLPGLDVRIVKPGTLEASADGELLVRGHAVMKGYYNKPAETGQAITADGWLHTGDLALRMPDGYFRITGRIKDMIIRGGENIYPREIEEFLYTHPAIADVQVVGLPDACFVEEVCAWIRLKPSVHGSRELVTEEDIRQFCRGRIAHFKVPRYVVFVDEFPTTVTGKVQKFRLREIGIERFGLERAARMETA